MNNNDLIFLIGDLYLQKVFAEKKNLELEEIIREREEAIRLAFQAKSEDKPVKSKARTGPSKAKSETKSTE